ncbi:nucleoside-diphosphate-sugar epimerase/reductase [Achromobacter arsenitoxydans SY8]|uniref:Nucleoside-diphosphate-sugar epimerase/reductase n=1 Tax=Achromobacter arsenitoxydans SY8 TaxID=477184 RepID=H0FB30_9BURK|nr:nucleoside-diphosphate-sugar epimerase/reductase [Achromobacter arsenitoxydans SY8]
MALGRSKEKARQHAWYKHVDFHEIDLLGNSSGFMPLPGSRLMHLAWSDLTDFRSLSHLETSLPSNYRFIKHMVEHGVQTVLVAGTCLEYGHLCGPIRPETDPQPVLPYAAAKNMLHQQLQHLQHQQNFLLKWVRLFYMYGSGQNPRSVLAQLDAAIDRGDSTFRMSGGEQLRDYLPVEDVAAGLVKQLESPGQGPSHVCSSTPISIRRLVEERIRQHGVKMELELGYYPYPDYEPMAFWGANNKE